MKQAILIVILVVFTASNLSALTLDAVAGRNTIYSYPIKARTALGRLPSSGEYGIFVHITSRVEQGYSGKESLFFRLKSGMVREGQFLYTTADGRKIILAEKKWYGWRPVDGVKIRHSIERTRYPTVKVWIEIKKF